MNEPKLHANGEGKNLGAEDGCPAPLLSNSPGGSQAIQAVRSRILLHRISAGMIDGFRFFRASETVYEADGRLICNREQPGHRKVETVVGRQREIRAFVEEPAIFGPKAEMAGETVIHAHAEEHGWASLLADGFQADRKFAF